MHMLPITVVCDVFLGRRSFSLPLGEHAKDKFWKSFFKSGLSHVLTAHMNRGISFKDYFWLSRHKRFLSPYSLMNSLSSSALKHPEIEQNLQVSDGLQLTWLYSFNQARNFKLHLPASQDHTQEETKIPKWDFKWVFRPRLALSGSSVEKNTEKETNVSVQVNKQDRFWQHFSLGRRRRWHVPNPCLPALGWSEKNSA